MSDISTSETAPQWSADDEMTFKEVNTEMKRLRELIAQDAIRIAQHKAESAAITAENFRMLANINTRLDNLADTPESALTPLCSASEAEEKERELVSLRAEYEILTAGRDFKPVFADLFKSRL